MQRYKSGSSLVKTAKEERLDRLEAMLNDDWTDAFYLALGKLPIEAIKKLHVSIASKITDLHKHYRPETEDL